MIINVLHKNVDFTGQIRDNFRMLTKQAKASKNPIVLKFGSASVTIYPTVNRIYKADPNTGQRTLAAEHPQFTLSYYLGNERVRRKFTSEREARLEAEMVLTRLANGETEALKLSGNDRAQYLHAVARLKAWRPQATLLSSIEQFVDASERLGVGVTLREAVDYWLKRHPANSLRKPIPEIVEEIIKSKREAGKSKVYLKDLRSRLDAFAGAFNICINDITGQQVEAYLRSLKLSARTQNNHRRVIGTLFQFAIKRGYLPKDHAELDGVEKMVVPTKDVEIFTPAELRRLFAVASQEMKPYLAIGAFAGIRAAEVERLDWSDISLAERRITLKGSKTKTGSRRIVPMSDNLALWLAPCEKPFGPVAPFANMSKQLTERLAPAAEVEWKHNALRHSFVSYRVALLKNVHEVSLEAGNSPQMIHQHYRELVTEPAAKEWFSIVPDSSSNIVPMPSLHATSN